MGGLTVPSMEGRAIARPNATSMAEGVSSTTSLQWRAGQLPGRTRLCPGLVGEVKNLQWRAGQLPGRTRATSTTARCTPCPFNGGPGNCPAEQGVPLYIATTRPTFNGGPGNCPAERPRTHSRCPLRRSAPFNGGPGNCPAELQAGHRTRNPGRAPSMEGRAIARPNQTTSPAANAGTVTFNGGPGNCPAERAHHPPVRDGDPLPSMEGRAIARPNRKSRGRIPRRRRPFNGGPGNCPAEPAPPRRPHGPGHNPSMEGRAIARPNRSTYYAASDEVAALQWRAGQLPGRTRHAGNGRPSASFLQWRAGQLPGRTSRRRRNARSWSPFNGGPGNCPAEPRSMATFDTEGMSLQWRAGQLPGRTGCGSRRRGRGGRPFNGGPGNCPAEPSSTAAASNPNRLLQWRAGQLPGRTAPHRDLHRLQDGPSMEGRAIARPNYDHVAVRQPAVGPSMEGRAIARPNRSLDLGCLTCWFVGACERSRKLKLRTCSECVIKLRFALCYKASSGPRDLRAHRSARIR